MVTVNPTYNGNGSEVIKVSQCKSMLKIMRMSNITGSDMCTVVTQALTTEQWIFIHRQRAATVRWGTMADTITCQFPRYAVSLTGKGIILTALHTLTRVVIGCIDYISIEASTCISNTIANHRAYLLTRWVIAVTVLACNDKNSLMNKLTNHGLGWVQVNSYWSASFVVC